MVAFGLIIKKLYKKNLAYRDLEQGEHFAFPPTLFVMFIHVARHLQLQKFLSLEVEEFGCLNRSDLVKMHN